VDLALTNGPGQVVIADLDGDGKPDLVIFGAANGSLISIYRNISTNGTLTTGSFAPRVDLPAGNPGGGGWIAVADVDGDGQLDLVLANYGMNVVSVFKNQCVPGSITTNSFASPVNFAVGSGPRGVAVQDLDGDGKPEIVTANGGDSTVSVLRNIGTVGSITTNSFAPALTFATGTTGIVPQGVAIADVDGDGRPDLITVNLNGGSSQAMSVLRNTSTLGSISFAPYVDFPGLSTSYDLAIGDLDGDGKLDVVVGSQSGGESVSVFRNTSTPGSITTNSFAPHVDFAAGGWVNTVAIGDLDGDGKPDVVAGTQISSHLSVFRNTSTPGSFTNTSLAARLDFTSGVNAYGVTIGDLDGDGRPDIAFANNSSATLSIYQNVVPFGGPPAITSQPASCTNVVGTTASFSTIAGGSTPLNYQWKKNGTNIAGATSTNLIIINVQTNDAGTYAMAVTNAYGSTISSNAILTVLAPPTIVLQPASRTNLAGTTATFTNITGGTLPLNYQWQKNSTNLNDSGNVSGSATAILTLASVQDSDAAGYAVVITNMVGSITSSVASLTVADLPAILSQPTNLTVIRSSNATFNITAAGSSPLVYQWIFNGTDTLAPNCSSLTLTNVQLNQAGSYAVLVTNAYGSILSSNATLAVNPLLHFIWDQIPSPRFANTPFAVAVQTLDFNDNLATNFTDTVALQSTNGIPINPAVSANFIQGVWTGAVMLAQTGTNLVLQAVDNYGESGSANPIDVVNLPSLTSIPSGSTLYIFWPINPSGFVLETTPTLSPADWTPVSALPIQIGGQYLEPVTISGTNGFYRLRFTGQ
jgi:hypothetical protein